MKKMSFIAAALIGGFLFTTCDLLNKVVGDKKPEVTLKSVEFTEIDFNGLTLTSTVDVKNNISVDIPLPKFDWDLSVIESPFAKGVIQSEGSLESGQTTEVSFPVSFTYANLISAIAALTDENAKYKIEMVAHIPVPSLGELSFPFEHEGKIPIMRLPDIEVSSAPSTTFTYGLIPGVPTGATISFAMSVKNNGNVAVTVNDLSYDFKVSGTSLSKGGVPNKPRINPGATETITVNFPLTAADIVAVGAATITGKFSYALSGEYKFGIPEFPLLSEVGESFSLQ